MKWYKDLYVSEAIGKKANKIKWKINHNAGTVNIYLVCLPSNKDNLLDIVPAIELMQKGYPKKDLHVIGMAKGYDDAVDLTRTIIEQTYNSTGGVNVVEYLKGEVKN